MVMENIKADFKSNDDVVKSVGVELGIVGDEPTQIYASISAEDKAKKRCMGC